MSISFDGIASGLNTSELIKQLMQIERRPVVLLEQRVQTYQQRMDAWRDVNMRLASLETKLSDLLLRSAYEARKATSTDQEVVTASANNSAAPGTYEIEVLALARSHRVVSDRLEEDLPLGLADGESKSFTVNEATITVEAGDTLQTIADKLNAAEDAKVTATVIDNRLVIEGKETGVPLDFRDSDDSDGVLQALGILKPDGRPRTIQAPQHARVKVNGIEIERPSNEVEVVEGVTFTLRGEGTAVITVVKDVSGAVAKIKDVVDQLNSAMDFMSSRLAKDGILQGDATLVRLQSSLRLAFMDRADTGGKLTTLSEIGITFTREGRAELDESKLREALEEDAHGVYLLLAGSGEGDEGLGIARRARDLIRGYTQTGGVIQGRREMFEAQIASAKESIERMEERLERQEERLYRQFTAMEQALASLQTQSMWLQTQLIQLSMFGATR